MERGPHVPEKARLPEACSLDPCTRATAPPDPMQKLSLKVRLLSSEKATVPPATNKAPPALAFTLEVAELFTKEAVPDITMAHPLPAKIAPPVTYAVLCENIASLVFISITDPLFRYTPAPLSKALLFWNRKLPFNLAYTAPLRYNAPPEYAVHE